MVDSDKFYLLKQKPGLDNNMLKKEKFPVDILGQKP